MKRTLRIIFSALSASNLSPHQLICESHSLSLLSLPRLTGPCCISCLAEVWADRVNPVAMETFGLNGTKHLLVASDDGTLQIGGEECKTVNHPSMPRAST